MRGLHDAGSRRPSASRVREIRKHGLKGGGWRRALQRGTAPAAYQINSVPLCLSVVCRIKSITSPAAQLPQAYPQLPPTAWLLALVLRDGLRGRRRRGCYWSRDRAHRAAGHQPEQRHRYLTGVTQIALATEAEDPQLQLAALRERFEIEALVGVALGGRLLERSGDYREALPRARWRASSCCRKRPSRVLRFIINLLSTLQCSTARSPAAPTTYAV